MHDQRHLYAWDVETGRRRWSTSPRHLGEPTMFDVLRPPVGVGPLVHVVEAPGRSSGWCQLDAFDAAEGTFRWSLPIPSGHLSFPPLAATDDSVCIAILGNVHALGR